jgi:hypothetical protein
MVPIGLGHLITVRLLLGLVMRRTTLSVVLHGRGDLAALSPVGGVLLLSL